MSLPRVGFFSSYACARRAGWLASCLLLPLPMLIAAGESGTPATTPASAGKPTQAAQARMVETYGKLPLSFEANQGQTDAQVKFLSRGRGYSLYLTADEAVLSLQNSGVRSQKPEGGADPRFGSAALLPPKHATASSGLVTEKSTVLRLKLVGANSAPEVAGLDELPGKSNYFLGNDPKKWRTNVPNYAKVKYENVYPGIDLVYYGGQPERSGDPGSPGRQLEYDFVVAPDADPKNIKFALEGTERISVDAQGDLVLQIEGGEVRFRKPVVYQEQLAVGSRQSAVANMWTGDSRCGFLIQNPKSKIRGRLRSGLLRPH